MLVVILHFIHDSFRVLYCRPCGGFQFFYVTFVVTSFRKVEKIFITFSPDSDHRALLLIISYNTTSGFLLGHLIQLNFYFFFASFARGFPSGAASIRAFRSWSFRRSSNSISLFSLAFPLVNQMEKILISIFIISRKSLLSDVFVLFFSILD